MTLVRPTFFGIYTARSGIVASQANIDITGHNLSNILTPGYTRQRANLTSVGDSGYKNRLACYDRVNIGQGVDVNSISQLRDAGYDIRYRLANSEYGYQETKLSGLEDIGRVIDEFFTTEDKDGNLAGISGAIHDLALAIQSETNDASSSDEKMNASGMMASLTTMLQDAARKLNTVYNQQVDDFGITVDKINTTLESIAALNKQIKEDALFNNPALELKDERNLLLDELSGYLNIEYKYDASKLDELSINFVNADGTKLPLVQGDKFTTIDLHTEKDTDVNEIPHLLFKFDEKMKLPAHLQEGTAAVAVTDADCNGGAVGAYFDLLTGEGSFGADTEMRGVPYYQKMLDTIAQTLAQNMNDLNRGKVSWDATDGQWKDINGSPIDFRLTHEQLRDMTDAEGNPLNWQKRQLTSMTADDWNQVKDATDLANVIALNEDALAKGVKLNGAEIKWDKATQEWTDANGTALAPQPTVTDLQSLTDADGNAFNWQKYQTAEMDAADWNNVNDDNLANVIAFNQKALDALGDGAKYTNAAGKEIIKQADGTWLDKDGNPAKAPATKEEWQSLKNADGTDFVWQKQTVDATPADWENMTDEDLAEMLKLNQDMLKDGVYLLGKDYDLLTYNDDSGEVTAGNIVATEAWQKDKNLIRHTLVADYPSGANDNLLRMVTFLEREDITFTAKDGKTIFKGGFEQCSTNTNLIIGTDTKMCKSLSNTAMQTVNNLDENRMAISGVDDNEETANMMMFQKAFTASARIMTVMDEMLDTLINNTGVVGR